MINAIAKYLAMFFEFIRSGILSLGASKNLSYGLAIIIFTIIIRIILLPLNIKQTKSQVKMSEIQPETKKLQEKYKNDPQKANAEMMKLYKEKGVSPFSGCLLLIVQLPIIYALFYMFNTLHGINGVSFLWLKDLSKPDVYGKIPGILPILSGLTTFLTSAIMSLKDKSAQGKQTFMMGLVMGIFLIFMSMGFKSGLVLYWVVQNIIQIIQTYVMMVYDEKKVKNNA